LPEVWEVLPRSRTLTVAAYLTMGANEYDHLFKLLLIGDSNVGKSSILLRFTDDDFDEDQSATIGVDFKIKMLELGGKRLNLTIWDTAGQEKFRSLTSSYYRGTHGIALVYDVTKRESFENINVWLKEIEIYATKPGVAKLLIGNKVDLSNRTVSAEEGQNFAREKQMMYVECSAKTRLGISHAFEELVLKILEKPELWADSQPKSNNVKVGQAGAATEQSLCNC